MNDLHYILTQHADGSATLAASLPAFIGATIPAAQWQAIKEVVASVFWHQRNQVRENIKSGRDAYSKLSEVPSFRWRKEATELFRGEGKELLVLVWGIEIATPEQIPQALTNWSGLAPEERWWLATNTGAARDCHAWTPHTGWRKALYHILCENPIG